MKYFDKHGTEIQAGMMIRYDGGSIDKVYATVDAFGNDDLGVNASNDDYLLAHGLGEFDREFYPLSQFNSKEYEVIDLKPTTGEMVDVYCKSESGEKHLEGKARILKFYQWDGANKKAFCKVIFYGDKRASDRMIDTL